MQDSFVLQYYNIVLQYRDITSTYISTKPTKSDYDGKLNFHDVKAAQQICDK